MLESKTDTFLISATETIPRNNLVENKVLFRQLTHLEEQPPASVAALLLWRSLLRLSQETAT
jgi:hypothetical protein